MYLYGIEIWQSAINKLMYDSFNCTFMELKSEMEAELRAAEE